MAAPPDFSTFRVRINNIRATNLPTSNSNYYLILNWNSYARITKTEVLDSVGKSDLNMEFDFDTNEIDQLASKSLVIELSAKKLIGAHKACGSLRVDLLSLATGPVNRQLTLSEGGVVNFTCSMEQIAQASVSLSNLRLQYLVQMEPAGAMLTVQYTGREGAVANRPGPEGSFQSNIATVSHMPVWQEPLNLWFTTTQVGLAKESLKIVVNRVHASGTASLVGTCLLPLAKTFQGQNTAEPVGFTEPIVDGQSRVVAQLYGTAAMAGAPIYGNMKGGLHTDAGFVDGEPLFTRQVLPIDGRTARLANTLEPGPPVTGFGGGMYPVMINGTPAGGWGAPPSDAAPAYAPPGYAPPAPSPFSAAPTPSPYAAAVDAAGPPAYAPLDPAPLIPGVAAPPPFSNNPPYGSAAANTQPFNPAGITLSPYTGPNSRPQSTSMPPAFMGGASEPPPPAYTAPERTPAPFAPTPSPFAPQAPAPFAPQPAAPAPFAPSYSNNLFDPAPLPAYAPTNVAPRPGFGGVPGPAIATGTTMGASNAYELPPRGYVIPPSVSSYVPAPAPRQSEAEIWRDEGVAFFTAGQYERAAASFSKALQHAVSERDALPARSGRVDCYMAQQKWPQALGDLNLIIAANDTNTKALLQRGEVHEAMDNQSDALMDYVSVLSIDPNNSDAKVKVDRIQRGVSQPRAAAKPAPAASPAARRSTPSVSAPVSQPQPGDELPPFWEMQTDSKGRVFYVDHTTSTTHWHLPGRGPKTPTQAQTQAPLPPFWEERTDASGRKFYIDHRNQRTQWERPRA